MNFALLKPKNEKVAIKVGLVLMAFSVPSMFLRLDRRFHQKLELVDWIIVAADILLSAEQLRSLLRSHIQRSVLLAIIRAALLLLTAVRIDLPLYIPLAMTTYFSDHITSSRSSAERITAEWEYTAYHSELLSTLASFSPEDIVITNKCNFVMNEYYSFLADPLLTDIRRLFRSDIVACGTFRHN